MRVDDFNFDLPEECIALRPAAPRDAARLLQIGSHLTDHKIFDLPNLLRPGDVLVVNRTQVIPARLKGSRAPRKTGGAGNTAARIEATLHKRLDIGRWAAFARPGKRLIVGDEIEFNHALTATVMTKGEGGEVVLNFNKTGSDLDEAIRQAGEMPLPPYIASKRPVDSADIADYQTMFAQEDGSVAAPTAGLHFTPSLVQSLHKAHVAIAEVTLHVGAGTFLPVKSKETKDHKMHSEWGAVSQDVANLLNDARASGGRVIAVGTTSLRLLESATGPSGKIDQFEGETDIFITPGYKFRAVDGLLTNFHLPKSTLFMLVSALAGLAEMKLAYRHAIEAGYRFYSYGDACLIWPREAT